ncbi:hypothetical protein HDU87_000847 [Geranomyces variabilis]|uniref:Thioesterase domain-containing protein n=1 Tax=Geranomyces variabilis TaxID=109894 RepID=A0AAD5TEC7_9FUNG|nr:hypothetical protein HDU87_000847 [Geranomyces variabilis]
MASSHFLPTATRTLRLLPRFTTRHSIITPTFTPTTTTTSSSHLLLLTRSKHTRTPPHLPIGGLADVDDVRRQLPPNVAQHLDGYPSLINLPVQWGDQDAFGHLNNCIYLRYFESGRIAYFDQILRPHLSQHAYNSFIMARAIGVIVKSLSCKYIAPCRYPDILTIGVRIDAASVKKDRFTQSAVFVSHAQGIVVAEAECCVVTYDYREQRKANVPADVVAAWKKGEGIA